MTQNMSPIARDMVAKYAMDAVTDDEIKDAQMAVFLLGTGKKAEAMKIIQKIVDKHGDVTANALFASIRKNMHRILNGAAGPPR